MDSELIGHMLFTTPKSLIREISESAPTAFSEQLLEEPSLLKKLFSSILSGMEDTLKVDICIITNLKYLILFIKFTLIQSIASAEKSSADKLIDE
jgi:hypothetical protein